MTVYTLHYFLRNVHSVLHHLVQLVVKCNQYWPEAVSIPRLYGNIKVTMTEEEELALYCVRTFSVQEVGV